MMRPSSVLALALAWAAPLDDEQDLVADLRARSQEPVRFVLEAAHGQTMADAYDALVFLAPLERLRQSAAMPGLYAADFRPELARRVRLMRAEPELARALEEAGVATVEELVAREYVEWSGSPVPPVE